MWHLQGDLTATSWLSENWSDRRIPIMSIYRENINLTWISRLPAIIIVCIWYYSTLLLIHTESQVLKTPFKHTEIILHSSSFSVLLIQPYLFLSFTWWVQKNTQTLPRLSIIIVAFEHKIRHTWYLLRNMEICAQVLCKRFSLKVWWNQVRQILCVCLKGVKVGWILCVLLDFLHMACSRGLGYALRRLWVEPKGMSSTIQIWTQINVLDFVILFPSTKPTQN